MQAGTQQHSFATKLALIALAGLALRLGLRLLAGTSGYWTDGYALYAELAKGLAQGHGYAVLGGPPTAFRVPLYPLFIAGVTGGSSKAWLLIFAQSLVSSGTVVLTGLIVRRMAGPAAGLLAAAIYATWPYAAWHDVSLQESGLFAMLAALATWLLLKAQDGGGKLALAAGVALGLALLTRATLLPFAMVALVWLGLRASLKSTLLAGAAMLAVLAPWLDYSHRVTGAYALGTESGAALYAGNHPLLFDAYPQRSVDEGRALVFAAHSPAERAELAALGRDEIAVSGWYRAKGLAEITQAPLAFLRHAAIKQWAAFGPLPSPRHGPKADLAYALGWTPFLLLALAGIWQRRREWHGDGLLHLHILTFAATTALFWAQTAHRSYLDPYLAMFAAIALAGIMPEMWRKRLEA